MKPELRRMIQEHFGIPHPGTKKQKTQDPLKGQLDARDRQQAAILERNAAYDGLSEIEKQEIQWNRRNFSSALREKADKIVKGLKGEDCCALLMAENSDLFVNYLTNALERIGYVRKTQIGSPSIGLAWVYSLPEPLTCPHCQKDLPHDYRKKSNEK